MRKLIIGLTAATAGLIAASPASAQYYQPVPYGYHPAQVASPWLFNFRDQRYARMMQDRVQRIRYDIRQMGAMRVLSRAEVRALDRQAVNLERSIYRYSRYGVSPGEARAIDNRVRRLEERVIREARDWNRRPGARRYNPWNYDRYWNYYGR